MIELDFLAVLAEWPALLRGAAFTLALSAFAAVIGVALASLAAGCAPGGRNRWPGAWRPMWS